MKKIFLSCAVMLISTATLYAQQVPGEASFGSFAQSLSNITDQAKISVISNYGGTGKPGSNANVTQSGNQNNLNLNLNGNGNNIVTSQIGDLNQLNMDFNGSNSQFVLEQSGNSNELQMKNIKSNGINFQTIQTDGNNSLILEGGSTGSLQSMKIEQSGGMKIIIESNPIFSKP